MFKLFANTNKIQSILLWIQSVSFALLYSFLYYPQTNFLSDLCLILGALCSCVVIFDRVSLRLIFSRYAIPIWMIFTLFLWIIIHLIFFSQNYALQLRELESIWKRVFIATIFAIGFGINLSCAHKKMLRQLWLLYLGLMGPVLIYLFKFCLGLVGNKIGFEIPEYLKLYGTYQESMYSVYKAVYIAFWLPAFAVSLSQLLLLIQEGGRSKWAFSIFSVGAFLCIYSFYLLGSKNGIADSIIISLFFSFLVIRDLIFKKNKVELRFIIYIIGAFFIMFILVTSHFKKYRSWEMLIYDAKIGLQIDKYDHWKYSGTKGYPENELRTPVTNTNYERVAWAIVGLNLINENPLGYGLVERSFAYLTKQKWPETELDQSHSAWIDLTLGLGWIGASLIFAALSLSIWNLSISIVKVQRHKGLPINVPPRIEIAALLALLIATSLGWLTAEICQKNQLIILIFLIMTAAGFSLNGSNAKNNNKMTNFNYKFVKFTK